MSSAVRPILSIAIPAFDRPSELAFALGRFVQQIVGRYEDQIEIVVSDDCSPNDSLREIRRFAERYSFIKYRRYEQNIGLERNLTACADGCAGEYLWLFGDDDFIEPNDGLDQVMELLRAGRYDCYVFNRTRRSFDLSKLLSENWMGLSAGRLFEFSGLREFCLAHGFISIIGFISVSIFRRAPFQKVNYGKYLGTMYPQLGALLETFHDKKVLLVGRPLVCHRTQTREEKRAALGGKRTEANFMADDRRRNAIYFSHPYVAMLDELIWRGALSPEDVVRIPESTVVKGFLVDFLIQSVALSDELRTDVNRMAWRRTAAFFSKLPLNAERRSKIDSVLSAHLSAGSHATTDEQQVSLTISVVSPSYNQGRFLGDCLASVRNQSLAPLEHLVFDPGSKDDSRTIAGGFPHVTLIAEPDEGQSDALNKGFRQARGDIIAWLNSDDYFAHSKVFERVVQRFLGSDAPDIVYGRGIYINEAGSKLRDVYLNKDPSSFSWRFQQEDGVLQPALFMRRRVVEKIGPLRKDLHYSMDYEYWIRCMKAGMKFAYLDEDLAVARYHTSNKTYGMRGESYAEVCRMMQDHFGYVNHVWLKRYAEYFAEGHDGVLANSSSVGIKNQVNLDRIYRKLLTSYNLNSETWGVLSSRAAEKGYGDTLREMKSLGIVPPQPGSSNPILCGPYPRSREAHCDETQFVAEIFPGKQRSSLMIDVGAHHGSALMPFLNKEWRIFAFEPDEKNRQQLVERLTKHHNAALVTVDPRAVGNESRSGLPFYSSSESTGVSGLSSFLPSHKQVGIVDATTLTQALSREAITAVDFLKIDTEGYDLFVLKGFPWERFKPAIIECEFEDTKTVPLGYDFHDLANYLVAKGYKVYVSEWHPIVRYGIRHNWNRLVRYPCELADKNAWGNLVAFSSAYQTDEAVLAAAFRKVLSPDATVASPAAVSVPVVAKKSAPIPQQPTAIVAGVPQNPATVPASPRPTSAVSVSESAPSERVLLTSNAITGQNWHQLEKFEWGSMRWTGPGVRTTVPLSIRRDQEMLAVIAYHMTMAPDQIDDLRIEVDRIAVRHSICASTRPKCLVVHVPTRPKDLQSPTEFALVLPRTVAPASVPGSGSDARLLGIAILWIAAMPAYPQMPTRFPHSRLTWLLRRVGLVGYRPVGEIPLTHFDGLAYLKQNPEVADAVMTGMPSALEHYRKYGFKQGKRFTLAVERPPNAGRLSEIFDGIAYLEAYPDVADAVRCEAVPSALDHFIKFGRDDRRPVRRRFDGMARRGSAVDLVRMDAARLTRAETAALKVQFANENSSQANQLNDRLETASKSLEALNTQISVLTQGGETRERNLLEKLAALRADAMEVEKKLATGGDTLARLRDETAQQFGTLSRGLDQVGAGVATVVAGHQALEREMAEQLGEVRSSITEKTEDLEKLKQGALHDLERMKGEFAGALAQREAREQAMLQQLDLLRLGLQEAQGRLAVSARADDLDRVRRDATGDVDRLRHELISNGDVLRAREQAVLAQIDSLRAEVTAAKTRAELAEVKVASTQRELGAETWQIAGSLQQLANRLESSSSDVTKLQQEVGSVKAQTSRIVHPSLSALNVLGYQQHPRMLQKADAERLAKHWAPLLGLKVEEKELYYLAHRVCSIENACTGRLAASVNDMLLRILVARAVKADSLKILEIGTLFGLGVGAMHEALAPLYERVQFTVIDPLEGYYGASNKDILTGVPVNRAVFEENMRRSGVGANDVKLIQRLSTDPQALKQASRRKYDLLIIDADHTYQGVKNDTERFIATARPGAFVIFDDYNNQHWPDVKRYVDTEVIPRKDLTFVGAEWQTAVCRIESLAT
jgi:FkbM family methyltransferase